MKRINTNADITQCKPRAKKLNQQEQRTQLISLVTLKIRQSLELEEILQTTVTEVRNLFQADRVLIYRLWPDGTGSVVTEAVVPGWPAVLGQTFESEVFPQKYKKLYASGRVRAIEDVENAGNSPCLVELLQQFGVKAKLVVPILLKEELWGLLVAHQCANPRQWSSFEIELLQQLADQVSIALVQAQLREALRESEQRYAIAVRGTNDGLWDWNLQTNEFYSSPRWKAMLGYQEDEIGNHPDEWLNRVHPDDLQQLLGVIAAHRSGLTPQLKSQYRVLQKDGTYCWMLYQGQAVRDANGNIYRLTGSMTDITERKQVEEELRLSEARFRELAQREALLNRLANQIRHSLDLDTILETAVREIRDLLQIDRCLFIWYRPEAAQPVWEVVTEARSSAFPSLVEYCFPITALGPLTARVFNKKITRVDNVRCLSDPVERKYFFSVGYTALFALPIHTKSGKIGLVSCGHSSGPRPWRDSEVELLQAVADQIAIAIDQAELLHQSRTAAAVATEQATTLEKALCELQHTQAQLVQSEKMSCLGQMVAGVAHEINNPVSFIYGNLAPINEYALDLLNLIQLYQKYYPRPAPEIQAEIEAIDLDFLREDLPKILKSMKMGANRISEIILSLRNFSRIDEAAMKWVNIHEGLDNTLLILSHRLRAKQQDTPNIQVIKDYGNLPKVQCYPGQLNQAFMNILTNAIDAIEENNKKRTSPGGAALTPYDNKNYIGTLWICTEVLANCNQVIILIGDNGPGMTQEVQRRIFDPFFTTKPVGSGTGLGMSISYQIAVEKHRGQLECISAPGQGTAFLISVPISQSY